MWTALVLVWISSLSLSESKAPSQDLRNQTANSSKNASVTAAVRVLNDTSGTMTVLTPPVTLTTGTLGADPSSPAVTAGSTFRKDTAAYESYRKKEYTQVDYLINGMYADSEM
uniref:Uncharacterized protein n=1 Tax=Panthera tigris altaica TaxID=74533 RepID=A0A8C9K4N4_PANTA